jgi:PAS domain S-box-containing protein
MKIARILFLGFVSIIAVFLGYRSLSGTFMDSSDLFHLNALTPGPVQQSETINFSGSPESIAEIYEGSQWKADRLLHFQINSGPEQFPSMTFRTKQLIPPEAQIVFQWRVQGGPQRIRIDITDGPAWSDASQPGEKYFMFCDISGENWTTSSFPLSYFERTGSRSPEILRGEKYTDGSVQAVAITFFPHSLFALDMKEARFVWKSNQSVPAMDGVLIFFVGLLLWLRTTKNNLMIAGSRDIDKNAMIARGVYIFLALIVAGAFYDQEMVLSSIKPLLTFWVISALIIIDDHIKAKWTHSIFWSYRYFAVILGAWYLNVTHNPFLMALFLSIAVLPAVFEKTRFAFFSFPVIATIGLVTHSQVVVSSTLLPGMVMIISVTICAGLIREIIEHTKARREARYVQSLYEEVLENSSDSIYILDRNGVIKAANREFETLLNRSSKEIIGKNIREFIYPEDYSLVTLGEIESLENGTSRNYDLRFLQKYGDVRTALIREVMVSKDRYHPQFQIIATDITERKIAEAERERLVRELKNALAEVRTLGGLLPICASCKKIRDDKGYWTQLEGYIQAHSGAKFTHGICPDCMKELYPDFAPDTQKEIPERPDE